MTFNWGYKLMLAIALFVGMMGYLVYQSLHVNYELVSKDYYKEELQYQKIIDGAARANALQGKASVTAQSGQICVQLPAEMKLLPVSGQVTFYCPTDQSKDRQFPLRVNEDGGQYIGSNELRPGQYTVKLAWTAGDQFYFTEQTLIIHKQ